MARVKKKLDENKNAEKVHQLRGCYVIMDYDLASVYRVEIKLFRQIVRKNKVRFPDNFKIELTAGEVKALKEKKPHLPIEFNRIDPPIAFTLPGILMLCVVLDTPQAVLMSLYLVKSLQPDYLMQRLLALQDEIEKFPLTDDG